MCALEEGCVVLHLDVNMLIKLVLVQGGRSSAQHLGSSVTEQADLKSVSDVSPLSSIESRNSVERQRGG